MKAAPGLRGGGNIVFDIKITTSTGATNCAYMKYKIELTTFITDGKFNEIKYSVLEAHERLGHSSGDAMQVMLTCINCTVGKAKQKNVKRASDVNKKQLPGGLVYLDISTVQSKKGNPKATKLNWRIVVDEKNKMKITHFFKTKSGMREPTCELIKKWKDMNIEVKCLIMDNASEKIFCINNVKAKIGNFCTIPGR
jgi:hypothetical protein